jgi:hypothetical protein
VNPITDRSHVFYIALLLGVWVAMLAIVNPIGNFPLNDDWVYGKAVKYLLSSGHYTLMDNSSATLFSQVFWGALFCLPTGFSFTTLRISCIVLGFVAAVVFYFFSFSVSRKRKTSFLVALLLIANPLYFSLSNTFMTDIPFLCFAIISILFFYKTLQSDSYSNLLVAIVFSILATLTRQVGIVIPLAYGIALLSISENKISHRIKGFIPFLITFFVLYAYILWMKNANPLFDPYQGASGVLFSAKDMPGFVFRFFKHIGHFLYYAGFFLLPVLLFSAPAAYASVSRRHQKIVIACMVLVTPLLVFVWSDLPIGNILNKGGIGPKTLRDTYILDINGTVIIPPDLMNVIFGLGFIGALLVVVNYMAVLLEINISYKEKKISLHSQLTTFLILIAVGYSLLSSLLFGFFDRYLLPMLVITLLVSVKYSGAYRVIIPVRYLSAIVAVFITVFSILATHDYLAWNRARWQAFNYLTEECRISRGKIDGGYECNGWCFNNYKVSAPGKSYWFVDDDEYIIAFGEIPGYSVIKKVKYIEYFGFKEGGIYVLHRT